MKTVLYFAAASICAACVFFLSVPGEGSEPDRPFSGGPPPGGHSKGGPPRGGPPPHRMADRGEGGGENQRPGGPGGRKHTANEAQPLDLVAADEEPPAESEVEFQDRGSVREVESNGIPDHAVGAFPNQGNPNRIEEQAYEFSIPLAPEPADRITYMHEGEGRAFRVFGVTLDGVMMEPGTAETWMGDRSSGWNYEALGGAVPLGLDVSYGHVQPDGNYHYHGLPVGLMKRLGFEKGEHSPLIGWAADGFPIYALFGFKDPGDPNSGISEMTTGYELKPGQRPGGDEGPGGDYDGAFVQDYRFAGGPGALDECNGRFCVTPEFPGGTYAYFLTRDWPIIPRAFRGEPEQLKGPPMRGGPRGEEFARRPPPGSPRG